MEGWPLELLQSEKSPKVVSTYYRKGTVIVSDSSASDFIYIIKSVSWCICSFQYLFLLQNTELQLYRNIVIFHIPAGTEAYMCELKSVIANDFYRVAAVC